MDVAARSMALAAAYTAGAALAFGAAPADEADILARAGEYISQYEASLAMIVAEETYEQRYFTPHDSRPTEKRVLRSEVLIARLPLDVRWMMYRDVLSVDGRDVGGERGRLERIFRESHANALEKARALMRESARFNLGPVERNFNVPTLALAFLVPGNQERVAFALAGEERADGRSWAILRGVEKTRPTLLRSRGLDMPLRLEYWIDPESGAVRRTELSFTSPRGASRGRLETTFARNPAAQLWLPVEMNERYDLRLSPESLSAGYYVEGNARYGNVRRFEVTTEESAVAPTPPDEPR